MEPEHLTSWSQLIFSVAVAAVAISWAVGNLFKAMVATYGGVIKVLQDQNLSQQGQIDTLRNQHHECEEQHKQQQIKISTLESNRESDKIVIADMRKEIEELKEKSHVTAAVADVSVKIDEMIAGQAKPPSKPRV